MCPGVVSDGSCCTGACDEPSGTGVQIWEGSLEAASLLGQVGLGTRQCTRISTSLEAGGGFYTGLTGHLLCWWGVFM